MNNRLQCWHSYKLQIKLNYKYDLQSMQWYYIWITGIWTETYLRQETDSRLRITHGFIASCTSPARVARLDNPSFRRSSFSWNNQHFVSRYFSTVLWNSVHYSSFYSSQTEKFLSSNVHSPLIKVERIMNFSSKNSKYTNGEIADKIVNKL